MKTVLHGDTLDAAEYPMKLFRREKPSPELAHRRVTKFDDSASKIIKPTGRLRHSESSKPEARWLECVWNDKKLQK